MFGIKRRRHEIERLTYELNQALTALIPFARAAARADAVAEESLRLGMGRMGDSASTGMGVTFGHYRQARALLAELAPDLLITPKTPKKD